MKKENSNLFVYVLVFLSLFVGVLALFKPAQPVIVQNDGTPQIAVGAQSGQVQDSRQTFARGFQYGCPRYATTSTAATFTLTKKEVVGDRCYIDWLPNVNTTLTTMATTTMDWLGKTPGDTRSFILRNASSTAAATITLAAGTGVDFQKNEDTADLAIVGEGLAELTFIRKADSDVLMIMNEWAEAD